LEISCGEMSQKRCFAEMTRHQLWSIKQQEQLTNLDACWRNTWRYLTTNDRYWWLMDLFSSKYTNANSDGMYRLAMMTVMMMMILVLMHVSNQRPPINQSINAASESNLKSCRFYWKLDKTEDAIRRRWKQRLNFSGTDHYSASVTYHRQLMMEEHKKRKLEQQQEEERLRWAEQFGIVDSPAELSNDIKSTIVTPQRAESEEGTLRIITNHTDVARIADSHVGVGVGRCRFDT
jgi:hypothetical protein